MFNAPVTRSLLPVLLGALLLTSCKKEEPPAPPVQMRPAFSNLRMPVRSDPVSIPLVGTDGAQVTLGQVATGKVVVVIPWVPPQQQDAEKRIKELRDALGDLQGVQLLPVNVQRAPTPEHLEMLAKLARDQKLPIYVDAEVKLLPFINDHLRVRAKNRKVMTIPQYLVFTHNLRQLAIDIPSTELGTDATSLVQQALAAPPPAAAPAMQRGGEGASAAEAGAEPAQPTTQDAEGSVQEPAAP